MFVSWLCYTETENYSELIFIFTGGTEDFYFIFIANTFIQGKTIQIVNTTS